MAVRQEDQMLGIAMFMYRQNEKSMLEFKLSLLT